MTMVAANANWADLWDRVDDIGYHTQKGIDFFDRFGVYLKERAQIEEDYAKNLRLLARKNLPKKKEDEENPFTCVRAFYQMAHELESLAGQHEVIAERFRREIQPGIAQCSQEFRIQRKTHQTDYEQMREALKISLDNLGKSQKSYSKSFKEAEAASLKHQKADKNMDMSRADLEKYRNNSIIRCQQCDDAKQTYAHCLQAANDHQQQHYAVDRPQLLEKMRNMDELRCREMRRFMDASIKVEIDLMHIIQRCYDDMLAAVSKIDAQADSLIVVQQHQTGYTYPQPFVFEDLGCPANVNINNGGETSDGGQSTPLNGSATLTRPARFSGSGSGSTSKGFLPRKPSMHQRIFGNKQSEHPDDFSDLPPQQRYQKLQSKLAKLQHEITTKTQARDGLLKMQTVYRDNPKLGKIEQVEEQLSTVNKEFESLTMDVQKYTNYLREAESQLGTPITAAAASPVHSVRPHTKPPSRRPPIVNGESDINTTPSIKTQSLPHGTRPPQQQQSTISPRLATPLSNTQRSSYSEDSISSDGSAFSGSLTQLQQQQRQKSPNRTTTPIAPSHNNTGAHNGSSSINGANINNTTRSRLLYEQSSSSSVAPSSSSEGREVYNECDPLPALGTCTALYSFDGGSDGTAKMTDGEEMLLVERDEGDGWTRIRKLNSSIEGFVPTSYLDCKFYPPEH